MPKSNKKVYKFSNVVVRKGSTMVQDMVSNMTSNQNKILSFLLGRFVYFQEGIYSHGSVKYSEIFEALGWSSDGAENYINLKKELNRMKENTSFWYKYSDKDHTCLQLFKTLKTYDNELVFEWNILTPEELEIEKTKVIEYRLKRAKTTIDTPKGQKIIEELEATGEWGINDFGPFLQEFNSRYIEYKLANFIVLSNKRTQQLYELFKSYQALGIVNQKLSDIKILLQCDKQKTYSEFRYFNVKVLKPAIEEINALTDLTVTVSNNEVRGKSPATVLTFIIKSKPGRSIGSKDDGKLISLTDPDYEGLTFNKRQLKRLYDECCFEEMKNLARLKKTNPSKYKDYMDHYNGDDYSLIMFWHKGNVSGEYQRKKDYMNEKIKEFKKEHGRDVTPHDIEGIRLDAQLFNYGNPDPNEFFLGDNSNDIIDMEEESSILKKEGYPDGSEIFDQDSELL